MSHTYLELAFLDNAYMYLYAVNVYCTYWRDCSIFASQGIVKTLKDSFGFIERADVVKDVRAKQY